MPAKSLEELAEWNLKACLQASVGVISTIHRVFPALHLLGALLTPLWLSGTLTSSDHCFFRVNNVLLPGQST